MRSGWIKIHRQFLQWEWFDKPEMVQIFLYFLLKANMEAKEWHGIKIQRGQLLTSLSTIERDLRLGQRTIRTCINRLKSTCEVTTESTNRYTLITICNYNKYQDDLFETDTLIDTHVDKQPTSNRQATDKQPTTTKEYKNIRKKEYINNNNSISDEIESGTSPDFSADADAPTAPESVVEEKIPFKKIKDEWNATCTAYPKLYVMTEARKNKIRNRIEAMGGIEKAIPLIKLIFEKMMATPFLRGDNKRGWKASFDWIFENDKNWVKVYEGNYDPTPTSVTTQKIPKPQSQSNGTTDIYSNGNAGYEARQREFRQHIREKINTPDAPDPDLTGYY